jgi:hypothetical protein
LMAVIATKASGPMTCMCLLQKQDWVQRSRNGVAAL